MATAYGYLAVLYCSNSYIPGKQSFSSYSYFLVSYMLLPDAFMKGNTVISPIKAMDVYIQI